MDQIIDSFTLSTSFHSWASWTEIPRWTEIPADHISQPRKLSEDRHHPASDLDKLIHFIFYLCKNLVM